MTDPVSLLEGLLWSNFRVALLLAGVWLAIALLGARDGAFRHDIWLAAIAATLLLPVLSSSLPVIQLVWLPSPGPEIADPTMPVTGEGVGAVVDPGADFAADIDPASPNPVDARWLWLVVWIVGVVASIGWFAFGVASVIRSGSRLQRFTDPAIERLKEALCGQIGLRRRVELLKAGAGESPHTWGVVRPRIVLPADACDWPCDQLENVLLHELGHIRRFDWPRLCLMRVAASVYWFNPLIWLAVRECRFEAERACDEFVVRQGGESTDYAEQLVSLMAARRQRPVTGIALGHGSFARRVRSILASTNEVHTMSKSGTAIVATAIVFGAAVLAACQVTSGQPLEDAAQTAGQQQITTEQEAERAAVRAREEAERAAVLAREEARASAALAREEAEVAAALQRGERQRATELARLAALEQSYSIARERHEELLERYSAEHPEVVASETQLRNNERMIELARTRLNQLSAGSPELLPSLQSLEGQLIERERMIEELQMSLERTSAELVQRERELAELRTQLEEIVPGP